MQVILLAAGQSTRLDPISDKNLLEFMGKPLIEHQVSALKKAKMRDIVVVTNCHNKQAISTVLSKYKNVVITEQKKLEDGMAGGVLAGADIVNHKNILIMSTNDVFEEGLFEEVIKASKTKDIDGVIVGKKMNSYFPGGYLKMNKDDLITDIIEKPKEGKEPSKYVNLVLHIYNDFPAFVKRLKTTKSKKDDVYEVALDEYIKKGKAKLLTHKYTGFWQPIKFPWHVISLMNHYLDFEKPKIDKSAKIASTAVINGNVIIEKNVKVFDHAVIQGPAYIGEGSVVANNSLIRESMVGRNCVVGYSTEVARSYLNHDVWSHSNYIGDSIVDYNVSFGAGTVLGNLRFDEGNVKVTIKKKRIDSGTNKLGAIVGNGVRFGVNASTNPGVKIGKNSFIGGSMYIDKDVQDDKMVLLEQKIKVTKNNISIDIEERKGAKNKLKN